MSTTVMARTPERSHEQRMDALSRANEIRFYRARLKFDLKHGRRLVEDVLRDPPPQVATMKVRELLLAVPKVGATKARKVLGATGISPTRTVGGLTVRQRQDLLDQLAGKETPRPRAPRRPRARVVASRPRPKPRCVPVPDGQCQRCRLELMRPIPGGGLCGFCEREDELALLRGRVPVGRAA